MRGRWVGLLLAVVVVAWSEGQTATISVADGAVSIAEDGQCSVVEAIANANDDAATHPDCAAGDGADVVALAAGSVYTLGAAVDDADGANGLPSVTGDLVLAGNGATVRRDPALTSCNGQGPQEFRLLHVAAGARLRVEATFLENGCARDLGAPDFAGVKGGAIFNRGELILVRSEIRGSEADFSGGAVHNAPGGLLRVVDSTIEQNGANSGGAVYNEGDATVRSTMVTGNVGGLGGGGGFWNSGSLRISGGTLSLNETPSQFGNGAGIHSSGELVLEDCQVLSNSGGGGSHGSGLFNTGRARVLNCTFNYNIAQRRGGAIANFGGFIAIEGGQIRHNTADDAGAIFNVDGGTVRIARAWIEGNVGYDVAGAIWNGDGTVIVHRCDVENNRGFPGGGINNGPGGTMWITDSSVTGNKASGPSSGSGGGGVYNGGRMTVERSTVSNNEAGWRGGGFWSSGTLNLINTTVSGNEALVLDGLGAGIYSRGTLRVLASTIVDNVAGVEGGGIAVSDGRALIRQSIVAGNSSPAAADCATVSTGSIESAGHNLTGDGGACPTEGPGDAIVDGAMVFETVLGPLQDNGGWTPTHAPLAGSPAIDAAVERCPPPATDQRGVSRPLDGDGDGTAACDIGAVEHVPAP